MRLFILLIGFLYSGTAFCQPFNLTVYREADGLPSGYIEGAMEDSRGYLWLATFGGISRFDGKSFVNYDIKEGLPNKYCDELMEDKKGRIWIATRRGLSMFDGNKFTNYIHPDSNYTSYISTLKEDKQGDISFLLSANGHSDIYKIQGSRMVKREHPKGFADSAIWYYLVLDDGTTIFKTYYHAYALYTNGQLQQLPELDYKYCKIIKCLTNGFYYATEAGIFLWQHGVSKRITNLSFKNQILTAFYIDKQERLWLASQDIGLWVINLKDETDFFIDANKDLPGALVPGFYQDKQGTHWICTFRGLVKATDKYVQHFTKKDGILDEDIKSSGSLTHNRIFLFNTIIENGSITQNINLTQQYSLSQKEDAPIFNMVYDEKERLWLFGKFGQVYRYNASKSENLSKTFGEPYLWYSFFDTTNNTLWMGHRNRIILYRNDSIVKTINALDDGSPLRSVMAIEKDTRGNIWISERDRLLLYNGNGFVDASSLFNLPQKVTIAMQYADRAGIWLSTSGYGAIHIKYLPNNTFVKDISLDNANGLPNNEVLAITKDDYNYLWVATLTGLFRVDIKKPNFDGTYNVYPVTANEGIHVNNWNLAFLEKDNFKNIWLGTANGIFKIETNKINTATLPPAIQIEDIQVSNLSDKWFWKTSDSISQFTIPATVTFTYTQNNIVFTCQGINLKSGFVRYSYILEGQEKAWHTNQSFNKATYNNLAPGNYTFRIKAINEYGVESKAEAVFAFEILPPFWQRLWFRLLVIALVIATIYYFVKQREKKIQKDNDLVLKMSELKLTALQSQMNPHFIFNSLNSIQNYIMQQKPVEAARYLSKFSRLIRRILDHSFNHLEPLTDIVETIKMYVELEAFRFSNEFKYTIELRDEDEIGRTELPPMLLQPFVENAIIHGLMPKEGEKHLQIIMEQKKGQVLISIDDNGVGRKGEVEKRPGHISRAEKIVNDMLQTMESLQGVQPTINFIDKKDDSGNAAGTRVEIIVPVK